MSVTGKVVDRRAVLPVIFRLPGMGDVQIDCVVDTGFSEAITLPIAAIATMRLSFIEDVRFNLANDATVVLPTYSATIVWHGKDLIVRVLGSGRKPLIGVALMWDYLLGIDFVENGIVTALPRS